ncbi:MAG TPA: phage tail protein [Planctomycetota bacterium]|nr:phage tail protein [Planctomycetota bacterium]
MSPNAIESPARPLRADLFRVEIAGADAGGFASCAGLEARRSVLVFEEGGRDVPRLFPGGRVPARIVLERGFAHDPTLWRWFLDADPREAAIVLVDERGEEVRRWELSDAWPCAWIAPELDASTSSVAIERVEIVCEDLRCP